MKWLVVNVFNFQRTHEEEVVTCVESWGLEVLAADDNGEDYWIDFVGELLVDTKDNYEKIGECIAHAVFAANRTGCTVLCNVYPTDDINYGNCEYSFPFSESNIVCN